MKQRMKNLADLVKAGISTDDAFELQRLSRAFHRQDEDDCTIPFSDEESDKRTKREDRREAKAGTIAAKYGRKAYQQGDPRGWSLYLVKPEDGDQYTNGLAVCSE